MEIFFNILIFLGIPFGIVGTVICVVARQWSLALVSVTVFLVCGYIFASQLYLKYENHRIRCEAAGGEVIEDGRAGPSCWNIAAGTRIFLNRPAE